MPLGKASGRLDILFGDRKKPEVFYYETINEICDDDFSWSLRAHSHM
jgi:hypothetical protein